MVEGKDLQPTPLKYFSPPNNEELAMYPALDKLQSDAFSLQPMHFFSTESQGPDCNKKLPSSIDHPLEPQATDLEQINYLDFSFVRSPLADCFDPFMDKPRRPQPRAETLLLNRQDFSARFDYDAFEGSLIGPGLPRLNWTD